MYFPGGALKKDIWTVTPGSQDEIRMLYLIFPAIRRSDNERLEWCGAQKLANTLFHLHVFCGHFV